MNHDLMQIILGAVLVLGVGGMSGCATIVHLGSTEDLNIKSEPAGAKVVVDGADRGVTPLEVEVERKRPHTVVISMDGYKESTQRIESSKSWWLWGNAVFGGLIGLIVDLMNGGGYTLDPDDVKVNLERTATAAPVAPLGSLTSSTGTFSQ